LIMAGKIRVNVWGGGTALEGVWGWRQFVRRGKKTGDYLRPLRSHRSVRRNGQNPPNPLYVKMRLNFHLGI